MAELLNVDPQQIRSAVSKLNESVSGITQDVAKIKEAMAGLDKSWQSDVKQEFFTRYRRDEEAMQEMIDQYNELSQMLNATAEEYERTESEMKDAMGKLRY
ncbi:MAG: WXG100 family type VII secretion target [Lachnospiraceae bacterium]|nr:WXG100 family type VII secretion target [Lachnospiraceae bacterium]